jgi:uncharacterized protein (TIGR02444 family)
MTLWDWAVEVHGRPGVEALCLRLQDDHGQCVSYLLWAAWMARQERRLSQGELAEAAAIAKSWETNITQPLRRVRRALKSPAPGMPTDAQAVLRQRVQADELAAERLLLETLERCARATPTGPTDLAATFINVAESWDPPAPRDLLQALGERILQPLKRC